MLISLAAVGFCVYIRYVCLALTVRHRSNQDSLSYLVTHLSRKLSYDVGIAMNGAGNLVMSHPLNRANEPSIPNARR
ncbi:hypothetical protein F5Y15DRAFT_402031 [Xylariaceae sp. FL0016]|nr:hypothetical protein F5Y15DRAFT_402031 [Xylariaceae sp. FL0016]